MSVVQHTLSFVREIDRPVETVWDAYADVRKRSRWSVPEGEEIVYDTSDLTPGGRDGYRCGPPGDLSNVGEQRYYVVDPGRLLVCSDTVHREGRVMAVALLTWEFEPTATGTRLSVVDQVTSLVGQGMIDGHRHGHEKTLDRLVRFLTG